MSGTTQSCKKAVKTIKRRHGEDFYKRIGSMGGKSSITGGFASDKIGKDGLTGLERAKLAGAKGGRKSKRKPKNNDRKEKNMTNKELTELMIKQLLHEWKREKSITTAYDICNTLCEYYKIKEKEGKCES